MKAQLISSIVLAFIAGSAVAAERAVETVNGQADLAFDFFAYDDKEFYDEDSLAVVQTLHGEIAVPLGAYLGLSLGAQFAKYSEESTNDDDDFEYEGDMLVGAARIFYRNPAVGRISLGYARERTDYESSYNGYDYDDTNTSYSYLALVEGYLGPITVGLRNEREFLDYGSNTTVRQDIAWASLQWYVVPRVRLGFQVGLEEAKDSYVAEVEFQPGFMGDRAGIYLGYMRDDNDFATLDGLRLGVNFYFNSRVDLITRDRHYR